MLIRALVLAVALAPLTTVSASIRHDLDVPDLAATIDGKPLPDRVVDVMQRLAQRSDKKATRADVVQALVDDRLLAAYARAHYPAEDLIKNHKVAYSPAVQLDQSLVSDLQGAFGPQIMASVRKEKGGDLNGVIRSRHMVTAAEWNAVLGAKPRMLLEYALDEKGRQAAAGIAIIAYRLDKDRAGRISLLDIYDAQNVQGRNQIHSRDAAFVMEQAQLLLERRYVLHWGETRSPLGKDGYAVFRQAVEDRLVRDGWMEEIGVSTDIHEDSQHLKALAAAVTPEEIRDYYDKNHDQFLRVEKVKARHIQVADQAAAEAAYAALEKGEDFAALAKKVSLAADKEAGGDMGWIVHGQKQAVWLESLAFVQKAGVVSKPFRSPGKPGDNPVWEILRVDERVEGLQPLDSAEVRYVAAQAIARQRATQEYHGTLEAVRRDADIRLHPGLMPLARKGAGS